MAGIPTQQTNMTTGRLPFCTVLRLETRMDYILKITYIVTR